MKRSLAVVAGLLATPPAYLLCRILALPLYSHYLPVDAAGNTARPLLALCAALEHFCMVAIVTTVYLAAAQNLSVARILRGLAFTCPIVVALVGVMYLGEIPMRAYLGLMAAAAGFSMFGSSGHSAAAIASKHGFPHSPDALPAAPRH